MISENIKTNEHFKIVQFILTYNYDVTKQLGQELSSTGNFVNAFNFF